MERRHRQRARVEDRIRDDKDTGLAKLPFKAFAHQRGVAGDRDARARPDRLDPSPRARRRARQGRTETACATGCCTSPPGSRSPAAAASCTSPHAWPWTEALKAAFEKLKTLPAASRLNTARRRHHVRADPPGHRPRSPLPRTTPNHHGISAETPRRPRFTARSTPATQQQSPQHRRASHPQTPTARSGLGGSETGDERDASSLGIAEGPLLAGVGAIQRPASVLPTAVRAAEAEVIRLRHVSSITTRSARCWSSRKRPSPKSAGRRPFRP